MRQEHARFVEAGLQIVGIGMGTPERSRSFRETLDLPFPLLSDPERVAYRAYGLGRANPRRELEPGNIGGMLRSALRYGGAPTRDQDTRQLDGSFVVDQTGIVLYAQRAERTSDAASPEALLRATAGMGTP